MNKRHILIFSFAWNPTRWSHYLIRWFDLRVFLITGSVSQSAATKWGTERLVEAASAADVHSHAVPRPWHHTRVSMRSLPCSSLDGRPCSQSGGGQTLWLVGPQWIVKCDRQGVDGRGVIVTHSGFRLSFSLGACMGKTCAWKLQNSKRKRKEKYDWKCMIKSKDLHTKNTKDNNNNKINIKQIRVIAWHCHLALWGTNRGEIFIPFNHLVEENEWDI